MELKLSTEKELSPWSGAVGQKTISGALLGSQTASSSGIHSLSFTPTSSTATIALNVLVCYTNPNTILMWVNGVGYSQASGYALVPTLVQIKSVGDDRYEFGYNGQMKVDEVAGNHYNYPERDYDPRTVHWWSVDPLASKFPSWSPYSFCLDNPILLLDKDGREPNRAQAGTVGGFTAFLNNTSTRMGTLKGAAAENAMIRLGSTEMNWKHMRPEPTTTAPFNNMADRYIYTEKGGWLDMAHFMFYAGKAYSYKLEQQNAQKAINNASSGSLPSSRIPDGLYKKAGMNPVGEAMQDGYRQEMSDRVAAKHSAYSYEDLPTDKMAADFGANYFDPKSKLSLGQQISNYINNNLGATSPESAPNYSTMPAEDSKNLPSRTNHTTTPVYTKQNP